MPLKEYLKLLKTRAERNRDTNTRLCKGLAYIGLFYDQWGRGPYELYHDPYGRGLIKTGPGEYEPIAERKPTGLSDPEEV